MANKKKALPKGFKKAAHNHLAEGEATGHFHAALEGTIYVDENDNMILQTSGTEVTHQEHKTVEVPAGDYSRHIVQEVDEDEEIRSVID